MSTFNPLSLFGFTPKEETPAAKQAHSWAARLLIRTAAFAALFGVNAGFLWLSDHWVNNPLSSRFTQRTARMLLMGSGAVVGGTLFLAISRLVRETKEITLQIPTKRDAEGKIVYDSKVVSYMDAPDLAKLFDDILAGHDEEIYVGVPSDKTAAVTLGVQMAEIRDLLGIVGVHPRESPTVDALKAHLAEVEVIQNDARLAAREATGQATAYTNLRNALGVPDTLSDSDIVDQAKKAVADHLAMSEVVMTITGKASAAGARELKRLHEKGQAGVSLPEGFRYDADSASLVFRSSDGKEVDTSFDVIRRASELAAQIENESGHEPLEISHEGGSMYQIRAGADRTPLLAEKVRGRDAAQKVVARLVVEQNRGHLGAFGSEGFTQRVNETALAVTMAGQVTNGTTAVSV